MPCFHPLTGWRSQAINPTGKRSIVFKIQTANVDMPITLPCGRCIGCRLERSRQWAIRCVHEATLYERNTFITLTYDPEHLPEDGSLNKTHFQDFIKALRHERLRKRKKYWTWNPILTSDRSRNLRYFHCGEYGEKMDRPHYHAALFNLHFADQRPCEPSRNGSPQWESQTLTQTWGKGRCRIGTLTFDSAAYVARYITKKITGDVAEEHYGGLQPEYTTMSRRSGIGKQWYDKYKTDCYPSDSVIMRGMEFRPPKFYDRQFELDSPDDFTKLKHKRKLENPDDGCNPEYGSKRMAVKEKVQLLNLKNKRSYENK